jgi:hypothetical protein
LRLFGFVFGHPRHLDGKELLTSPVVRCHANRIVTRSGSEYELGSIDPAYERRYPDALNRLFARLEQGGERAGGKGREGLGDRSTSQIEQGCIPRIRRFLLSLGSKQRAS